MLSAQKTNRSTDTDSRAANPAPDFGTQVITVCEQSFVADPLGALFWPDEDTVIVADLHLEKGSSFARSGQLLPPYDTRETLARLAAVLAKYDPVTVISLGDSLHDKTAAARINDADKQTLRDLQRGRDWVWVTGNHDPNIDAQLGGVVHDEVEIAGLFLRHEPDDGTVTGEIAGHLHPAARMCRHGNCVRRPCFASNGQRLIMPAFGVLTGGLNVLDPAFFVLGEDHLKVWMLGRDGLYPIAPRWLRPD